MRIGTRLWAVAGAALLVLTLAPAATGLVLEDRLMRETLESSLAGGVNSTALRIGVGNFPVLGTAELTLANGAGSASWLERTSIERAPVIPESFFLNGVSCGHPLAVRIGGTNRCLHAQMLRDRGVAVGSFQEAAGRGPTVPIEDLVKAGVATLQHVSSQSDLSGQKAEATVAGVLIPGLSDQAASCGAGNASEDEVSALPVSLPPVIDGNLTFARCSTASAGVPSLRYESGEAVLDLTLNQTLVQSLDALNDAFDALQGAIQPLPDPLRTPLDNTLEELQTRLNSQPMVKVRVAPNSGSVTGGTTSVTSTSMARGATIDLLPLLDLPLGQLDGIAQITVAEADASAAVADGVATASNGAAVVRVKVLDILTPDPGDVLIDLPVSPGQDLTILENTPLQSTIKVAATPEPVQACTTAGQRTRCEASAEAHALSISLFDPVLANGTTNPLPNVTVQLATAGASAVGDFLPQPVTGGLPVELPRTGALPLAGLLGGTGLAALGLLLRRRLAA